MKSIKSMIKDEINLCICLICMIIFAVIIALIPPLILERLVDKINEGQAVTFFEAVFYFLILVLVGFSDSVREILITKTGQRVTKILRKIMCEKLDKLGANYFTMHPSGTIVSLFVSDVDTIQSMFSNGVISMTIDLFQIVSIMIVIFIKSLGLGITMLFVIPLIFLMTRKFQKNMLNAQMKNRAAIAKVTNHIPETMRVFRMMKNLRKQNFMQEKYDEYITQSYEAVEKSNFYDSIYSPIIIILSTVIISFVMVMSSMGGKFMDFFGMSAGTAVAIIAYVGKIFSPIETLGMEIQNIQEALAGAKRVKIFLNEKEEKIRIKEVSDEEIINNENLDCIVFSNVSFSYEENSQILKNVSFSIKKGENVTLTGRTGCGKSTIFKLILGLYSPQSGNVTVFGNNADEIQHDDKNKIFGYVEQSFHMINGTVADQISLGSTEISRSQIIEAAKIAGLHETILSFPDGYDQKCTQEIFSHGQFQLLSIARAIVYNPPVMLLDEITANLDSETEKKVIDALNRASKKRTVISISHRIYEKSNNARVIEIV